MALAPELCDVHRGAMSLAKFRNGPKIHIGETVHVCVHMQVCVCTFVLCTILLFCRVAQGKSGLLSSKPLSEGQTCLPTPTSFFFSFNYRSHLSAENRKIVSLTLHLPLWKVYLKS